MCQGWVLRKHLTTKVREWPSADAEPDSLALQSGGPSGPGQVNISPRSSRHRWELGRFGPQKHRKSQCN
jgi:hypothetical protein